MRTSPTELKKPTPLEEADTVIDIFDNTLFDSSAAGTGVFRRLGAGRGRWQRAARVPGVFPSGQQLGIGSPATGTRTSQRSVRRAAWRRSTSRRLRHLAPQHRAHHAGVGGTPPSEELMNQEPYPWR